MASISKIRYTNVIYENGNKRYNDELFTCAGHNTAILLENGGGKTVFIQAALQAVLPHTDLGERRAKETFVLDGEAAHIAIEWILSDKPRRYGITAVTLYLQNNELKSYKYTYEYGVEDKNHIENLPFTKEDSTTGSVRAATRMEMNEYYQRMSKEQMAAHTFSTTKEFHQYIEAYFKIIPEEWRSITVINGGEGSVEAFFDGCKTTTDLVEKLLLPTVEQALVGKGSDEFAGTFESQREHFNKHKQLERSIKESEKIKTQIEDYVASYSAYHQKVKDYEAKREEAKAFWEVIGAKEQETRAALAELDEERKSLEAEKKHLEKSEGLIEVSEANRALEEAKQNYEKEELSYRNIQGKQDEKEKRRHILKLARFQTNMKEAQSKIKLYEEQLALLSEDMEVEALKEALEENSGQIKGCFEEQLEHIKVEKQHTEREKERYIETQILEQRKQQERLNKIQKLRNDASKITGKMEHQKKQMNHTMMAVVSKGGHEDIEMQNKQWTLRMSEIETHKVTLGQSLRDIEETKIKLSHDIEKNMEQRTKVLGEIGGMSTKLGQLEEAEEDVLETIKKVFPVFYSLSSIYLKPQQVITAIEEQVEKMVREKEEALLLERRHAHFLENYENHDFFTAEPLLENWVDKWQNQFDFLQTGTAFIESLEDKNLKEKMYHAPKWAGFVIVADGSEEALIERLKKQQSQMTYPVNVIGLSKAKAMLVQDEEEVSHIYPSTWSENMQTVLFDNYKKEVGKALEEAITFRKQKEKQLREIEQVLEKVSHFLVSYPHEKYAALREESAHLKRKEAELLRSIEEDKYKLIQLEKESRLMSETLRKEGEEKNRLQSYLEKTAEYLNLKEEVENDEKRIRVLHNAISEEEVCLKKIERDLRDIFEALEEAKEQLSLLRSSENRIKDDPIYKEVKDEKAIYSNMDLVYLRNKREQLKENLSNKQKGRKEIEDLLKQNQSVYEENKKSFCQEQAEREETIESIPSFREEYALEIDRLTEELKALRKSLELADHKVKETKTDFDKKEHDYQSKKQSFETQYEKIDQFIEDDVHAKEQLKTTKAALSEKEKYLSKQIARLEKELKFILEHKLQMDKKDELYGYCAPEVKAAVLDEIAVKAFMYEIEVRMIVGNLLESLAQLKCSLEESKKAVEDKKLDFKLFCQREIRDSKLRNMAVQGIMQKQDYEELILWKENIVERINHTLTILERDLLDQDQQISQFIIHLYTYLRTVATELAEIPRKTRVNTEAGWKTIYEFMIPSWQEDSGKEKIRNHIYGLLDDIEGNSFKDDTGKEDIQKIKKYIKEQFKLKTLLKIVMGNDAIRVRCRKVSNINDISSQKFSWETSNKWSGGEKWSKNMALYLGILNYLAEKKQNIQSEEERVSRVVMLDNPFGKASSGHVLEPVFFIAKQLGFQIIALTAHSEGDFIRRYFPIVYSCKLRSTLDQRTAIFSKEQEIKKAYFMDNDPIALSILGSNQIGLF